MKKYTIFTLGLLLSLLVASPVLAGHGSAENSGATCPLAQGDPSCTSKKSDCESQCPINNKILKKAHFFIENKDAIGLSEDQVHEIKTIKMNTKKKIIRQNADMEIFEIELWQLLHSKPANQEAVNQMIDQASAGWGSEAKAAVQSYLDVKAVLTEAQMTKAKAIWGTKK